MSKRDDIIIATKRIIASEGVSVATIANILKRAKTGYGTLYNYFDSKDDLYTEVYKDIISRLSSYVLIDYDANYSSKEQLSQIIMRYMNFSFAHIEDFYTLEAFRAMPEIIQMTEQTEKQYPNLCLEDFLRRCVNDGYIKERQAQFNQQILLGILANFTKYYHESKLEVTENSKQDVVNICFNALK